MYVNAALVRFSAPCPASAHCWYVRLEAGGSAQVPAPFQVPNDAGASRPSRISSATRSAIQVMTCNHVATAQDFLGEAFWALMC